MTAENFSIIAGTASCNAACPFCVSKMTGLSEVGFRPQPVNWRNFEKACLLAKQYQVKSVIITGKGEPTLFPDQISEYLDRLEKHRFPLIDLQTNGVKLQQQEQKYEPYLKGWYDRGLAFIALSLVHYSPEENREVYQPSAKNYIDLPRLIDKLHDIGYSVRLSCTMFAGGIDSPAKANKMTEYARSMTVEQLTLRRVSKPLVSESQEVFDWTSKHSLSEKQIEEIKGYIDKNGRRLAVTGHGAGIYDINGQNVCLTDALTLNPNGEDIRQLIFFPDGRIRFDWQFKGATIL